MSFYASMITNIQSQNSFTGKSVFNKNIKQVKRIFFSEFKDVKSPARYELLPVEKQKELTPEIKELSDRLKFVRHFNKTLYQDGGLPEVFRGLIGCVKAFKVGNCAEFAEIGKTILKMNGINNCDIYTLHAKSPDGTLRNLDQTLIAFKVPHTKNNPATKRNGTYFKPMENTRILDLWLDGFSGNIRQAKKKYKILGMKQNDELILKPENTYEPDLETIDKLKKVFPKLIFNDKK